METILISLQDVYYPILNSMEMYTGWFCYCSALKCQTLGKF